MSITKMTKIMVMNIMRMNKFKKFKRRRGLNKRRKLMKIRRRIITLTIAITIVIYHPKKLPSHHS